MKRIIALFLGATMCVSLAACGITKTTSTPSKAPDTATAPAASVAASAKPSSAPTSAPITGSVTASGSSALLPLAQAAAESFMKANPNCAVTVNGGGSGTGLTQVSNGAVDIGNSDVFASEKLDATAASSLIDHQVCTVTITPVVNKSLTVSNLTTQQLTDIFTAKVKNWKDVGGPDLPIILVTRPDASGTRALFKTWAIKGASEAHNASLETDDSGTLLQTIQNNPGAIGYVSLAYLVSNTNVKTVSLDGVVPSLENTYSGKYLVWGYEHMYTKGAGSAAAQAFIAYMTGDKFSSNIETIGYGVMSKMTPAAIATHK